MKYEIIKITEPKAALVAELSIEGKSIGLVFLAQVEPGGYKWLAFDDSPFTAAAGYVLNRHDDVAFSNSENALAHLKRSRYDVAVLPKGTKINITITL